MPPSNENPVAAPHVNKGVREKNESASNPIYHPRRMRIICIGAGLAGLCFAYKLQRSFEGFELVVYEKNDGIAGVWFENRYPG